ncbi:hypothetical protein D3C71_1044260 [compost metagenome]
MPGVADLRAKFIKPLRVFLVGRDQRRPEFLPQNAARIQGDLRFQRIASQAVDLAGEILGVNGDSFDLLNLGGQQRFAVIKLLTLADYLRRFRDRTRSGSRAEDIKLRLNLRQLGCELHGQFICVFGEFERIVIQSGEFLFRLHRRNLLLERIQPFLQSRKRGADVRLYRLFGLGGRRSVFRL